MSRLPFRATSRKSFWPRAWRLRLEPLEDRTLLASSVTPLHVPDHLLAPLQAALLQPTVDLNLLSPEMRTFFTSQGALLPLELPATRVIYLGNRSGYSPTFSASSQAVAEMMNVDPAWQTSATSNGSGVVVGLW